MDPVQSAQVAILLTRVTGLDMSIDAKRMVSFRAALAFAVPASWACRINGFFVALSFASS